MTTLREQAEAEIEIRRRRRLREAQQQQQQEQVVAPPEPPPRAAEELPKFIGGELREALIEKEARKAARSVSQKTFVDPTATPEQRAAQLERGFKRVIDEERRKARERLEFTVTPQGGLALGEPVQGILQRPTRIREVPVFEAPLAEPVRFERLYKDPDTGELRPPTAFEELREAYAPQVVLTEAQARARVREVERQRAAREAALAAGEPVPEFDEPEAAVKGALSRPIETGAVIETPLAALLRGAAGTVEGILSAIYFDALGYDVDPRTGEPIDPDDIALKIRENIDEIAPIVPLIEQAIEDTLGPLPPEMSSGPPVPPLFGATTRRAEVPTEAPFAIYPSGLDPEQRRVAADTGSAIRDFARNLTVGRGFGDEWYSSEEARKAYAERYGSEDAAWWAGTLASAAIPTGPGTAARMAKKLGKVLAEHAPILSPTQNLIRFADSTTSRTVNAAADIAAAVSETPAAQARVVKRAAQNFVRGRTTDLGEEAVAKALDAIDKADANPQALARAASKALGENPDAAVGELAEQAPEFLRMQEAIVRNTPGDFVMVTDAVAVPRDAAAGVKQAINTTVRGIVERQAPEIAAYLRTLQRTVGEADADLAAELAARADEIAKTLEDSGAAAAAELARGRQTRALVERAARAQGQDARTAGELFTRSTPDEVARKWGGEGDTPVASLRGVQSWDDVDSQTLRLALEEIRSLTALRSAPGVATATRRLSDLQTYVSRADNARALDTRAGRAARVLRKQQPDRAPLSVERARQEIIARAGEAFRSTGKTLDQAVKEYGSVESALDELTKLTSVDPPSSVWSRVLSYLYAEDLNVVERVAGMLEGVGEYPTVAALVDLDRQLVAAGIVKGWDTKYLPSFAASLRTKRNMEKALLKNLVEEGIRKGLSSSAREYEGIIQGILREADDAAALRGHGAPTGMPVARFDDPARNVGMETRHYDVSASNFERRLAENGEDFATILDSVPVSQRAAVSQLFNDLKRFASGVWKGAHTASKYGYAIPNLPVHLLKLVEAPVISLATIGLENTARALAQVGRRLDPRAWVNRKYGGVIRSPDGVVYTQRQIDELIEQYGLGLTAVDSERVGMLANDLLVNARKVAAKQGTGSKLEVALDAANPVTRSLGTRMAEAIELTFRRAVFEAALAGGEPPSVAADLARRSQLDLTAVPDAVANKVGEFFPVASQYYQITAEAVAAMVENPAAVRAILKLSQRRAQAADPYGLRGDEELLSTLSLNYGNETIYGPANPVLLPAAYVVNFANNINHIGANLYDSITDDPADFDGYVDSELGETGTTTAADMVEKLRVIGEAMNVPSLDTPGAIEVARLSDEEAFMGLLLMADALDPDRQGGVYESVHSMLSPVYKSPPAELAVKYFDDDDKLQTHPRLWARQPPEGTPYIRVKGNERTDGLDGFYVIEPSATGGENLRMLRALTPDALLRLAPYMDSERMVIDTEVPLAVAAAQALLPTTERRVPAETEAIRMLAEPQQKE